MLHPRPSQLTVSKNKCFLNPQKGRGRTLKRRDLRGGFRAGFLYPVVDFLVGTKDGSYPNPYLSSNLFPAKPPGREGRRFSSRRRPSVAGPGVCPWLWHFVDLP